MTTPALVTVTFVVIVVAVVIVPTSP